MSNKIPQEEWTPLPFMEGTEKVKSTFRLKANDR